MIDHSGKLTVQDMKTVQNWIARQGLPSGLGCPICGEKSWTIGENLLRPLGLDSGAPIHLGVVARPLVMMVSPKCGYTFFLNAAIIGLVPGECAKGHL